MGDLKTFFDKAVYPDASQLSGDGVVSSGSDPNAEGNPGPAALQSFWPKKALDESENPSIEESSNSVSGLPKLPNRFEPPDGPVDQPSLERRSPGTIDKR